MFEEILALIRSHERIILHRHSKPDGDAIGSQFGMLHLLQENFPEKEIFVVGDAPGTYTFVTDREMDALPDEAFADALCIILDSASRPMISDERYALAHATARIDHHLFCETIADAEVIDSSFESCCGMITAFALESGLRLNAKAAKALYTGMVTDSGRFRYDSTSPRTFRLAAALREQDFNTNEVFRQLYADDFAAKQLKAQFILKIRFSPANVAYIYTTKEEFDALNVDVFTVSRGMVGTMADIRGVDIWVNFTETDKGVLCELRSSKYNINPVAVKYGGGGHTKASGATVADRATAMAMLADLDAMMGGAQ